MAGLVLLASLGLLLVMACGQTEAPAAPTRSPFARVRPTPTPTVTPRPTNTSRPRRTIAKVIPLVTGTTAPIATPVRLPTPTELPTPTPVAQTDAEARNLVWVYLTQCSTFDPSQLTAFLVQEDWYVKASAASRLKFGVWRVDATTGHLEAHDIEARKWQPYVDSGCDPEAGASLFRPTPTPTPTPQPTPTPTRTPRPTATPTRVPTPTPVVRGTSKGVASVWAHLVKCFPDAELNDFTAVLDPVTDQYVVKDKEEVEFGVWRVARSDGAITPDNDWARRREQTIRSGVC